MKRILLTGMSGTGKSTIVRELRARGHRAIDTDDGWSHWIDIRTGLPAAEPSGDEYVWDHLDWVWNEEHMLRLLTTEDERPLIVAGTAPNQGKFYSHFHHVILLSAPTPIILERLQRRRGDAYGATPRSRSRILEHIETVEPRIRAGADMEIDTSRPLEEVLDRIVGILHGDGRQGEAAR